MGVASSHRLKQYDLTVGAEAHRRAPDAGAGRDIQECLPTCMQALNSPLIYALVSNLADQRIRSVRGGQQTASAREKVTREQ